jgi:hypothetical protein
MYWHKNKPQGICEPNTLRFFRFTLSQYAQWLCTLRQLLKSTDFSFARTPAFDRIIASDAQNALNRKRFDGEFETACGLARLTDNDQLP